MLLSVWAASTMFEALHQLLAAVKGWNSTPVICCTASPALATTGLRPATLRSQHMTPQQLMLAGSAQHKPACRSTVHAADLSRRYLLKAAGALLRALEATTWPCMFVRTMCAMLLRKWKAEAGTRLPGTQEVCRAPACGSGRMYVMHMMGMSAQVCSTLVICAHDHHAPAHQRHQLTAHQQLHSAQHGFQQDLQAMDLSHGY
jgi:hypothetical protein